MRSRDNPQSKIIRRPVQPPPLIYVGIAGSGVNAAGIGVT
jgi:hypothetical protein